MPMIKENTYHEQCPGYIGFAAQFRDKSGAQGLGPGAVSHASVTGAAGFSQAPGKRGGYSCTGDGDCPYPTGDIGGHDGKSRRAIRISCLR